MPEPIIRLIAGEYFRVHVISRRNPGVRYLVDLESFKLNGQCGCEHFAFGCQPKLKGDYKASDSTRCWHIKQARSWVLDRFLSRVQEHVKAAG
jgi:hypothetical protein